jgi:predicted dehydrogenase
MKKKLGAGIVGYGWAATAHIDAIRGTGMADVRAICSSRALDPAEIERKHGAGIRIYSDLKDMLEDESVEVVAITSHPWKHREQAEQVARAGRHIILEKPMALDWEGCQSLAKVVEESGVGFCLCFECRFSSQFQSTRSIIEQGLIGDIHYGEVDYYHGIGPWYGQYSWNTRRDGGGSSLLSAGCHALDALLMCMGDDVESVTSHSTSSRSGHFSGYEYDTSSVTLVKFASGRIGKTASVIDCLQPYYFHTHLIGSKGSILDNKVHFDGVDGLNRSKWSELSFGLVDSGDVADHPYQNQFARFFEAIGTGEVMPQTGLREALRTHQVIFAADESAKTGLPVSVGPAWGT